MNILVGCANEDRRKEVRLCKRGNIAPRDKHGHCLCADCKQARALYQKNNPLREYKAQWLAANPGKASSYTKKWNAANKEKRRAIEVAWQKANPGKRAEINARAGKKWAANNRATRDASVRARRLAKIMRTPKWADLDAIRSFYRLAKQISKETGIPHEVDHIVPLQGELVSGLHVHNNLQIIPRSDNRSKGNTWNSGY